MSSCDALLQKSSDSNKPERLQDRSIRSGILSGIERIEDEDCPCQIAKIGDRLVVLPLGTDLSKFLGQHIVLMQNFEDILVRRAGHDILGAKVCA